MSAYARPQYEEQGKTFTLVKTSQHNRSRLREYMDERNEKMLEREEALEERAMGNTEVDVPDSINQYEMYWDWFVMLTDGPHDDIERKHFDEKLGEKVLSDFVPQATRTLLVQQGLLPPLTAM